MEITSKKITTKQMDAAITEGFSAGRQGYPRSHNPYTRKSLSHLWDQNWIKGYTEARMTGFDQGIFRPGEGHRAYGT